MAVLRFYLNYTNDEDLARGLLILFLPFRDELKDIHSHDVKQKLVDFGEIIERKRSIFEKYKTMTDLISTIQPENEADENKTDDDENEKSKDIETTSLEDIEDFNRWAKHQASKDLSI